MRAGLVVVAVFLAGCGVDRLGEAGQYRREAPAPVEVVMPPDATYISQQFLVSDATTDRHEGIDLWGARGTPVLAAAPGVVVASWREPLYGQRVRVDHGVDAEGRRVFTRYFHLEARSVVVGQRVARGQLLGRMGATGVLAGGAVHLHFEVWRGRDGASLEPIDPHLVWADGVGRVTCFEAGATYPAGEFVTTYPNACGAG